MITEIRALYECLTRSQQREIFILIGLTLAAGASEFITVSALVPFLSALFLPTPATGSAAFHVLDMLPGGRDRLFILAAIIVIVAIVSACLRLILVQRSERFCARLGNDLVKDIYRSVMREEIAVFDTRNTSEVLAGVDKVQGVEGGFVRPLLTAFTSAIIAACLLAFLLLIAPILTLVLSILFALLYFAVSKLSIPLIRRYSQDMAQGWSDRTRLLRESLGVKREIMLARNFDQFEGPLIAADRRFRDALASNQALALSPRVIFQIGVTIALVTAASAVAWLDGDMTAILPVFAGIAVALQRIIPLTQSVWNGTVQSSGNRQLVRDVIRLRGVVGQSGPIEKLAQEGFSDRLESHGVSFAYAHGAIVIDNVNLAIRSGEWVGISGASGSGKSTLLDLLVGLQSPSSGTLMVDGEVLAGDRLMRWQRSTGYVREASFLLDGSIADNICFGEAITERCQERLDHVLGIAQLSDFIASLDGGVNVCIGEGGVKLSAGQRQRIAIARALYRNPSVLVLDEGTNAVELVLEEAIFDAIAKAMPNLTLIIVTHRVDSMAWCTRRFEVSGSKVTEVRALSVQTG